MAPDETATPESAPTAPETPEFSTIGPRAAAKVSGKDVQANLSAIGTVSATSLSATGSLIGVCAIDQDATITASMAPAVMTRGDLTFQQSYASAMIVGGGGETRVHQAAAPLIVGKTMDLTQTGACVLVTGEADVKSSWIGIVLSPKTNVSEDSHVLVSTTAALIIAAALFGGLGLVALAISLGVRRVMHWRPTIALPTMPQMPDVAALRERISHLRAG